MRSRFERLVRVSRIPDRIPDRPNFPSGERPAVRMVRVSGPRVCMRACTRAHGRLPGRMRSRAYVRVPDLFHVERKKP